MLHALRRLILGLALIAAASAALVLSDRSPGRAAGAAGAAVAVGPRRIAVVQISSIDSMVVGRDGLLEHLAKAGWSRESGSTIDLFNAEGDIGTLNQIAAQVCGASPPYDLLVSLSTPATQAMLRANKRGLPHVFGLVASPPAIGIPLGPWSEGSTRPRNVAGFGTLQPAELLLSAMRDAAPGVRRLGCVWNPAEANAEASVRLGREVCAKMGIELVEANGANVTEVVSSADVVLSRGIDAFWILADTNVIAAAKPVIERCRKAGVPVVTNFPNMAQFGAAINYGADYRSMGLSAGAIAELVLRGTPPSSIPCDNFVPVTLWLAEAGLAPGWTLPEALRAHAERIYPREGPLQERTVAKEAAPPAVAALLAKAVAAQPAGTGRLPVISVLTYSRTPNFEDAHRGFLDELPKVGLEDGRTCRIVFRDAQLDIGTLNTIVATVAEERPDVVVPFTTPAVQAVVRRIRDRPVVFAMVASGVATGAGTSNSEHLPNVTGAQMLGDWPRMVEVVKATLPGLRRAGTVFAPSEANSVYSRGEWERALRGAGIELVAVGADRPTELAEAAEGLATKGVGAILQINDNASITGFTSITKAADRAGIPVFGFAPATVRLGATLAVARDYESNGRDAARLVARVLRGEAPAGIPFQDAAGSQLIVNPDRLSRLGIRLPESMMQGAKAVREGEAGKP